MIRFKKAVLLVPFGVFLALLALEGAMRIGAWAMISGTARKQAALGPSHETFRILCLGESTTQPTSGTDYSWPVQLEEILNAGAGKKKYEVVNEGVGGVDTTVILSRLPVYLERYRPDLVVSMMGVNDFQWFVTVEFKRGWPELAERLLRGLRIIKLFRYIEHETIMPVLEKRSVPSGDLEDFSLANDLAHGTPEQIECLRLSWGRSIGSEVFPKWERACLKAIRRRPMEVELYRALGDGYAKAHRKEDAVRVYEEYVGRGGGKLGAYKLLIVEYLGSGRFADAERIFKKALTADSGENKAFIFTEMARVTLAMGQNGRAEKLYREAINSEVLSGSAAAIEVHGIDRSARNPSVTAYNFRMIHKMLKERHIPWVVMQYPRADVSGLRGMLDDASGILFVSNRENFESALARGRYPEYFVDDFGARALAPFRGVFGHCTPRGYRLIAEHLAEELREHGMLGDRPTR